MPDIQPYKRSEMQTCSPLVQSESGWYRETLIENHTGVPIFAMQADGDIQEIPPLYSGAAYGQRVLVKQIRRVGLVTRDPGIFSGRATVNSPKYPRVDVEVAATKLAIGPIFIKEAGLALAFEKDVPRLREENYLDPDFCNNKITDFAVDFLNRGYPAPMLVIGNCHDTTIDFLHIEINGMVVSIKLNHDLNTKEELRFLLNRNDSHTPHRLIDLDWSKMAVHEVIIGQRKWIVGTDIEKVHLKVQEKVAEQQTRLTRAEVESQVSEKTAVLQQQLSDSKIQLDNVGKELRFTKDELINAKAELNKANDLSKGTFEQQQLAMKMNMQVNEQALALHKMEYEKARMDALLVQTKVKSDAELAIASAKVRKEVISVEGAETSNYGTIAKTVTVVAPIAAAAAAWMHKQQSASSICAMIGGSGSVAGILPTFGVIAAVALLAKPVVSMVTHSINVISSKAKEFWSWLWD